MSRQPTRRRATRGAVRTLAVGVAVAALVGMVGAGQALAAVAVPDERVLERQGMIDRQKALGQADEKGTVALPRRARGRAHLCGQQPLPGGERHRAPRRQGRAGDRLLRPAVPGAPMAGPVGRAGVTRW